MPEIRTEEAALHHFDNIGRDQYLLLSARAALFALPLVSMSSGQAFSSLALWSFRSVLMSWAVMIGKPTDTAWLNRTAAKIAHKARVAASGSAAAAGFSGAVPAVSAFSGGLAASYAAKALSDGDNASSYSARAISAWSAATGTSFANAFSALERAEKLSDFGAPVWTLENKPEHLEKAHLELVAELSAPNGPWLWWHDWYLAMWDGSFTDWDFALEVAKIDWDVPEGESAWDKGPAAVAARIAELQTEVLLSKAPVAERVEFDPDQGRFRIDSIDIAKPDLLAASLSQVADALEDVLTDSSNGVQQSSREVRELRRLQTRYANDPQRIEMGFVSVHKSLSRQVLVSKELPASEQNLALMDAIEEGAKAIRATHPDVAENRRIVSQQTLRELPPDGLETLEAALPVLVAISDEELAAEWQADIPQLINDAMTPLPTGAPPLPGMDESVRVFNRAAKISLRLRTKEVIDKIKATPEYGVVEITTRVSAFVALGIYLFSLIF